MPQSYHQLMIGIPAGNLSNTLENSFIQSAVNRSYERLLGDSIDPKQPNQGQYPQYFSNVIANA